MKYGRIQKKIVSNTSERVIDELVYFYFDGIDKNTIQVWLVKTSLLKVIQCWFKSKWNRRQLESKAIDWIDNHEKLEELTRKLIHPKSKPESQAGIT